MDGFEKKVLKVSRGFTYTYYITPATPSSSSHSPLLFWHGWPDSHRLWVKLLPKLRILPNRLVLLDLLGYGGTDKPTDTAALAYDGQAKDVVEILDAEKIPHVVSIGHDHGAVPSTRIYSHYPDRVAAVINLNVAYNPRSKNSHPFDLEEFNEMTKKLFGYGLWEYWHFLALDPHAPRIMQDNADRLWEILHADNKMKDFFCVRGAFKSYLVDRSIPAPKLLPHGYDDDLKRPWIKTITEGGFESPLKWYNAIVDDTQGTSDAKVKEQNWIIRVPYLFIGATGDAVCRKEHISRPIEAGLLPGAKVVTVEGGHYIVLEKPDEVSSHIVEFLSEHQL